MNIEQKAAATAVITAIGVITVPPWFTWCRPIYLGGDGGPPGYICIGNTFMTPWFAIPVGVAIAAGLAAALDRIWSKGRK